MAKELIPPLPAGFVLDSEPQVPELPSGFVLTRDLERRPEVTEEVPSPAPEVVQPEVSLGERVAGVVEPAAAIVSGGIAEPIAGLAGILQGVNPFAEPGAAARAVGATREALTFEPTTQAGRENLQAVAQALQPVGEVITGTERFLGDKVFKVTNSPLLASAAASLPTAILETIGLKGGGKIARSSVKVQPSEKAIRRSLVEAAPSPETLKNVSRGIFQELDESGVRLKPEVYKDVVTKIRSTAKKAGLSERTTPRALGAIQDLEEIIGTTPTLSEIDDLRKVAQGVARTIDPTESALGSIIVSEIDDFLDAVKPNQVIEGTVTATEIGKKYKAARNLWGRARKTELVQEAIQRAQNRASGFENGLRVEFDKIARNKKLKKFFKKAELDAINDIVKGDAKQNLAKLIGRFGLSEGRATNVLGALSGAFLGTVLGGTPGFVASLGVGSAARRISQKITKNKAAFIEATTKAGTDGKEITKAYLKLVPKKQRSIEDLSNLLSNPKVDLQKIINTSNIFVKEAAEVAAGRQVFGEAAGLTLAAGLEDLSKQEERAAAEQQVAPTQNVSAVPTRNDLASRIAEAMVRRRGE